MINPATAMMKNRRGSKRPFTKSLTSCIYALSSTTGCRRQAPVQDRSRKSGVGSRSSHRSRNSSVLADAPEMHGHQHRNHERQADAVQHVEPQQRALTDERAAEKREPRIRPRV